MSNPNTRKSCVVPKCTNTTINAPEKLFFLVPMNSQIRKKWIKAMKRLDPFGDKSRVYGCEDHFDIENDMENYVKYKLVGGRIKLIKGTVPHKFKCQENKEDKPDERSSARKRDHKINRKKLLIKEEEPLTDHDDDETDEEKEDDDDEVVMTEENEELFVPSYIDEISKEDPLSLGNNDDCLTTSKCTIGVQVNLQDNNRSKDRNLAISKKNKGVQCNMQNWKRKVFHVSTNTDET